MSYLDKTGLSHFFEKLKGVFAPKDRGVEYIRGTWTAASGTWTGVTKDSELYDGKQIILYMPFAGSGNATLNLTLAGGGTTGAKNVYFESTTRFTTHKGQNSQLPLVYHKALKLSNGTTYEGWWYLANRDTNDNRTHTLRLYNRIKAKKAIAKNTFIVGDADGYEPLAVGVTFDLTYPVLFCGAALAVNGTNYADMYEQWYDLTLTNTLSTFVGIAGKMAYIVGTLSGTKLTVVSPGATCEVPASEDGKVYLLLGRCGTTYSDSEKNRFFLVPEHPLYAFQNGSFGPYTPPVDAVKVNGHTVNADVPSGAKFTDTTYTAASAAPGKIAKDSAQGTSTNYARQDHTHGIDVGTGDANGQVKIAGQNASVKGLAALAYKASLGKSDVGLGNVDNTADADKEVKNATALKTARNLSGIAFDGSKNIHRFGLCSTAANVAAKTVTLEDDMPFTLEKDAVVFVKMTNANSIANPTLNVNDTGAKAIKRYATTAPGTNADQSWVAGSVRGFVYDGSYWMVLDWGRTNNDNTIPQAYCSTAAGTAAKGASMTGYALLAKSFVMVTLTASNTAAGPLTLNINSKGAKPIYINGAASSATHNGLPAGSYLVYYDGTNYYFRTDGKIAAEGFSGSGADLTDLNASELSSGTVPTARLPVATEDANGIVNNTYIRKMNELWETHEATTVNNSVVSGAFAITINAATSWRQDSYTDYWYTKINLPTIKRGAEIIIRYDDCQFLYMLEPPEDGWIEALDGEVWLYTKTLPDFSVINSPDWIRVSAYFINHTSIDSGRYDPPFKMEKIWENANPTATFPPQMLDLNLRAYDMAVIETLGLPSSNDQGICYVTGVIVKGVTSAIMGTAKTSNRVGLRKYTMSDEGIDIAEGIYNAGVNNNYFVPSRIYGIRGLSEFDVEPVWETWIEEGEENSNLFYEGFSASLQNNGNAVQDYGWRTYDGITGWLINTRAQGNSWAYLYSNDKIDVTNYSYIVVDCYFYCYGGAAYVGLTQQNAPAGNSPANVMSVYAHPVSTRTKFRGEVRLNVKDLTGEYRLVIASAGSGESSYQGYSMIVSTKAR